jgi:hypothetical protein
LAEPDTCKEKEVTHPLTSTRAKSVFPKYSEASCPIEKAKKTYKKISMMRAL